ncbi:Mur ligase family protein, partial [Enterocloster citroniae]
MIKVVLWILFFSLQNKSPEGNQSIKSALDAGCRYVIVDDPTIITDSRFVLVDDVLQTLQQLANYHRRKLKTPVIAITGTCGKTTTKELIAAVLSSTYKIVSTPGSANSSLILSLILLTLTYDHELAVIEMGACCSRMIRELCWISQPSYGIITNVGLAHLDGFNSLEGVISAKSELYDYLRQSGGKIFIHKENRYLHSIAGGLEQISYGESRDAHVSGLLKSSDPCLCFEWESAGLRHFVSTQMAGNYNIWNALAAITV